MVTASLSSLSVVTEAANNSSLPTLPAAMMRLSTDPEDSRNNAQLVATAARMNKRHMPHRNSRILQAGDHGWGGVYMRYRALGAAPPNGKEENHNTTKKKKDTNMHNSKPNTGRT